MYVYKYIYIYIMQLRWQYVFLDEGLLFEACSARNCFRKSVSCWIPVFTKCPVSWPMGSPGRITQWQLWAAVLQWLGFNKQQTSEGNLANNKHTCRRKFRSQTSDNMDRWKAEQGRGREKRKIRREKIRRERVRRKKMQMREKVGKSRNTVFFQWFEAPEGRKVGSLKRRVRSQLARWEMKICTAVWREADFEVKMYKTHHGRSTFGSWDVEKVHAVVARSTFPSQNVKNTPWSDHFWKFRSRKSARQCGAKHISKSKCTKHTNVRTTFGSWDVEKVHTVVARSTFPSQNVKNTPFSDHFWKLRCRKSARRFGAKRISKSKC